LAPAKRPNANERENLNRFVTFGDTISRGDLTGPIRFRLRFGVDGELKFRVYPLPVTREALDIRNECKATKAQFCTIRAVSTRGTSTGVFSQSNNAAAFVPLGRAFPASSK